jgi:hypothetical protein
VNILSSSESWFRPSDVCVAPDGSLFVADWNDAGVGGHNMADRDAAKMTGRIYRVAPKGHKFTTPKINWASTKGCIEALQSPNLATRYLAWTKLHALQAKAEPELVDVWKRNDQRMRSRTLQLLARIKGKERLYVAAAVADKNPDIRIAGLRLARALKLDLIPYARKLVNDPSPQVRRECAIALHHNSSAEAAKLWTQLALQHDGRDRWYLEALGIGADGQWDKFFSAWLAATGDKWNTPAGRDIVWRSRSRQTPALLAKLITDKNTSQAEQARYFRSLDFISGPEKDAALLDLVTAGK